MRKSAFPILLKLRFILPGVFIFIAAANSFGQETNFFYRHYTGEIEGGLKLSMDVLSDGHDVSGHYYYYFFDHDEAGILRTGKTIPLTGTVTANGFSVSEFSQEKSVFTIDCNVSDSCTGTWRQKDEGKTLKVVLREDYSTGSIPLCLQRIEKQHSLLSGEDSPVAVFEASLLWPCPGHKSPVSDSVVSAVKTLLSANQAQGAPQTVGEDICKAFFNSYILATEGIENLGNTASFSWENKYLMYPQFNENNLLSIRLDKYVFTGGAHGLTITDFANISLADGSILNMDDIFASGYSRQLDELLNRKLRIMNGIQEGEMLSTSGFFTDTISNPGRFYINHNGIGFIYNVYEIAPYSTGSTELFFTFDELKGILKPEFIMNRNREN